MSRHQRLQKTMRSPVRQAKRAHASDARHHRQADDLARIGLLTGIFVPPPDSMWRYRVRHLASKGPKYPEGDCRRKPPVVTPKKLPAYVVRAMQARARQERLEAKRQKQEEEKA